MSEISRLGIVIVAGGSSSRYGKGNKLFEKLAGLPVIIHSLRNFAPLAEKGRLILVVPEKEMEEFRKLCREYLPEQEVILIAGGSCRTESVRNGLAALPEDTETAAVHDGARPLASSDLLRRLTEKSRKLDCGVIAAEKMIDSVCRTEQEGMIKENVCREDLWRIQTPQVFPYKKLMEAYEKTGEQSLTDDSAAFRSAGFPVYVLENTEPNLKLTLPQDLLWLKFLLEGQKML